MRQKKKKKIGVIFAVVVILAIIAGIALYVYSRNQSQEDDSEPGHFIEQTTKEEKIDYTDISAAKAGDTVAFGDYKGKLAWKVLEKKDNELILLTDHCVARQAYHDKNESVTWATCSLRKWLNETFYAQAFSDEEKAQIVKTKIVNEDNNAFDTKGGKNTNDYVSLMSIHEAETYFKESSERSASLTDGTGVWWWLRSPGFEENNAANVGDYGSVNKAGHKVFDDYVVNGGVRPVIHITVK